MEKKLEENKLIADFMGWKEQTDPTEKNFGSFRTDEGILHKNTNTEPLLFHSSWDWLMPVIDSIYNMGFDEQENNKIGNITHALVDINIEDTYKSVLEFIKWYNKRK